jgi:hypothetical protein
MSDSTNPLNPQTQPELTNSLTSPQIEAQSVNSSTQPPMKPQNTPSGFNVKNAVVKNWKTTTVGLVISFTGFVSFSPETFGGPDKPFVQICKYVTSGGLAALGISSKDYNVTGGNGS